MKALFPVRVDVKVTRERERCAFMFLFVRIWKWIRHLFSP